MTVSPEGPLTPVNEPPIQEQQGATGVSRSRTLPSRKDTEHTEHNVLKKKRASSSQPARSKDPAS